MPLPVPEIHLGGGSGCFYLQHLAKYVANMFIVPYNAWDHTARAVDADMEVQ
jgi:hypothetical protein